MSKVVRFSLLAILFFCLILVRAFAKDFFYDPLNNYFQDEYLYISPEGINNLKLLINMLLRYAANTVLSLAIIFLIFKRKSFLKFASIFYVVAFIVLNIVFFYLLSKDFSSGYLLPFYIRRFIIHPVILLVLLPAFYYQTLQEKEV